MTAADRLKADSHSLPANAQMLMTAALVTESLQPVRQPIMMQNEAWIKKACLRLTLNISMIFGIHSRNPEKCVPDTAKRCEQQDISKSLETPSDISDLSPRQTAANNAL